MQFRAATHEDAVALREIDVQLVRDGRGMVMTDADVREVDSYAEDLKAGCWSVAVHEAGVCGYASIRPLGPRRLAHVGIVALGVHPEHQGQGIGRALMEHVLPCAWASGFLRIELYVRADNPRARSLYASLGFRREGIRHRFIRLDDGRFVDDEIWVRFSG